MSTREEMLRGVRRALGRPPGEASELSDLTATLPELGPVLPAIPSGQVISRFEEELSKVGGSAHRAQTKAELAGIFEGILKTTGPAGVVLSRNPLLARLGVPAALQAMGIEAWTWPAGELEALDAERERSYRERSFAAAAGITGADFALAETGSLVLSSRSEGAQLTSLAPPIHIALYLPSQVVATLEEVLARLAPNLQAGASTPGRSVVIITGTSRTADIEQILIRGVHGPREVHAILVGESCLAE